MIGLANVVRGLDKLSIDTITNIREAINKSKLHIWGICPKGRGSPEIPNYKVTKFGEIGKSRA